MVLQILGLSLTRAVIPGPRVSWQTHHKTGESYPHLLSLQLNLQPFASIPEFRTSRRDSDACAECSLNKLTLVQASSHFTAYAYIFAILAYIGLLGKPSD